MSCTDIGKLADSMISISTLKGRTLKKIWEEDIQLTAKEDTSFDEVQGFIQKKQEQGRLYEKYDKSVLKSQIATSR